MKQVWIYQPTVISPRLSEQAAECVSPQRLFRANRLRTPESKLFCLLGEALTRAAAHVESGMATHTLTWEKSYRGKPFFAELPNFHFNLSHTAGALMLAFHTAPIGVDVEYVGHGDPILARRFFAPNEIAYIQNGPANEISQRFCRIWTQKEAYVKLSGAGISSSLSRFDVTQDCGARFFCFENRHHCFCVCAEELFKEEHLVFLNDSMIAKILENPAYLSYNIT